MESSGFFPIGVITVGDFLREVVAILIQAISRVQVGLFGTVRDCRKVTDTEVNTRRLFTGSVGCLHFMLTHNVEFPSPLYLVVDGSDLL